MYCRWGDTSPAGVIQSNMLSVSVNDSKVDNSVSYGGWTTGAWRPGGFVTRIVEFKANDLIKLTVYKSIAYGAQSNNNGFAGSIYIEKLVSI